jgi:hypothetical protein
MHGERAATGEPEATQERVKPLRGRKKGLRLRILDAETTARRSRRAAEIASHQLQVISANRIQVEWRIARRTHERRTREAVTVVAAHYRGWRVRVSLLRRLAVGCIQFYWRSYAHRLHLAQYQLKLVAALHIQRFCRSRRQQKLQQKLQLARQAASACWDRHTRVRARKLEEQAKKAEQQEVLRAAAFVQLMGEVLAYREARELRRQQQEAAAAAQAEAEAEAAARIIIKGHLERHLVRRRIRKVVETKKNQGVADLQSFLLSMVSTTLDDGGDGGSLRLESARVMPQAHFSSSGTRPHDVTGTAPTAAGSAGVISQGAGGDSRGRARRRLRGVVHGRRAVSLNSTPSGAPMAGGYHVRRTPDRLAPIH